MGPGGRTQSPPGWPPLKACKATLGLELQCLTKYSVKINKNTWFKNSVSKRRIQSLQWARETEGRQWLSPGLSPLRTKAHGAPRRRDSAPLQVPPGWELWPVSAHLGWACRPSHPLWFSAGPHLSSQAFSGSQAPQRLGDYTAPSSLPAGSFLSLPHRKWKALALIDRAPPGWRDWPRVVRRPRLLPTPRQVWSFYVPEQQLPRWTLAQWANLSLHLAISNTCRQG